MSASNRIPDVPVPDGSTDNYQSSVEDDKVLASASANEFLSAPRHQLRRRPSANEIVTLRRNSGSSFTSIETNNVDTEGLLKKPSEPSSISAGVTQPGKWRAIVDDLWAANYGAFLIMIAQLFGTVMTICTRLLETSGAHGEPMHPFQILFIRQTITSILCIAYGYWSRSIPHFPLGPAGTVRWLLVSRGFFGFLGVFGVYFSLQYLPLSEATILTFLCPVGTSYTLSLLLPGEFFTRRQQMAAFVSLVGVIFIARPAWLFKGTNEAMSVHTPDTMTVTNGTIVPRQGTNEPTPAQHLEAISVAMLGVVGCIGAMTSIRSIGQRAHPFLSVSYFSVWSAIVSLLALLLIPGVQFRIPGNFIEWSFLLAISCCGFLTQWLITVGMAYGASTPADRVSTAEADHDLEMQSWSNSTGTGTPVIQSSTVQPIPQPSKAPSSSKASGSKAVSMFYLSLLFSLISDKVIFGITPVLWSWIGSGFILVGAVWVAAEGAKSKASTPDVPEEIANQNHSSSSKQQGTSREEEVGLLRDIDDLDEREDDGQTRTKATSSSSTVTGVNR